MERRSWMWHTKSFEKSSAETDETSESMSERLYDDQVPLFWLQSYIVSFYFACCHVNMSWFHRICLHPLFTLE
jgi:hypothetical protein